MLPTAHWTIEGGRFLPQEYIDMSLHINSIYSNLEIGMFRDDNHTNEQSASHPFCLMEVRPNGETKPVKYLREEEMNLGYLLWWLDKNGTVNKTAEQHFNELMADIKKHEAAQKAIRAEKQAEEVDLLASVMTSPLHTYRHNGNKIGADNNVPTLKKKES